MTPTDRPGSDQAYIRKLCEKFGLMLGHVDDGRVSENPDPKAVFALSEALQTMRGELVSRVEEIAGPEARVNDQYGAVIEVIRSIRLTAEHVKGE